MERDREVVAAIVAGDPAGLAAAYDKYARELYAYCRTLLREPADAADAVHDAFVVAAVSLSRLRDPERLRPWLYAVVRNLCLRKLRAEKAAYVSAVAEAAGEDADVGGDAERAETRALLRAASGGLNRGERDIVELRLWQGLDPAEAAAVLGITRGHVHSLLSRGRDQLAASVAALLVARTGREDCAVLDDLLAGWDGQLTVLLRKRLSRHIERCDICSDRRQRELRPALLTLWPAATLAGAALAEHAMHAARVPEVLRAQVLSAASGEKAQSTASSAGLGSSGRGFRDNGFPKSPVHRALAMHRTLLTHGTRAHVTLWGGAGVAAAVIAAAVFAGTRFLGQPGGGTGAAAAPAGSLRSSGPATAAAPPGSSGGPRSPGPGGSAGAGGPGQPGGSGGSGGSAGGGPGGGTGGVVPVVTLRTGAGPSPASPATSVPDSPPPSSSPAAPSTSAPPVSFAPPAPGTLSVSPTTVVLTPLLGSSLTLTARDGPVSWSISEPASLLGELVLAPSSGTLTAGQSVQVSISVSGLVSLDTTLTVNPGGQQVTVLLGVG